MTDNELLELNKKLAEWAEVSKPKCTRVGGCLHDLIGANRCICDSPNFWVKPDFPQSLDACFKWLVPKVIKSADYSIIITQDLARCIAYIRPMQGGVQYEGVDNQNPALALCLAIEKLLEDK